MSAYYRLLATVLLLAPTTCLAADSIAFVPSRLLARQSTGCTLANLGGIDKERAIYAEWALSDRLFVVTGGDTFTDGRSTDPDAARALADGLATLGVHVIAPSVADLAVPPALFADLVRRSGARWLATNVQRTQAKDDFKIETSLLQEGAAAKMHFLSLVPCDKRLAHAGWRCMAPEKALTKTLEAKLPDAFTVVVTTLPTAERDRLVRKYPAVSAWLDGRALNSSRMEAQSVGSVVVESQPYGLFTVRLQLEAPLGSTGPFVDALLLENARHATKTPPEFRRAIEAFSFANARRLRVRVEPVADRT